MNESLVNELTEKLHPTALSTSPKMAAILGYLLGREDWTNPVCANLAVTTDGFLLVYAAASYEAYAAGEYRDEFAGTADDLRRNLTGACEAAEVSPEATDLLLGTIPEDGEISPLAPAPARA